MATCKFWKNTWSGWYCAANGQEESVSSSHVDKYCHGWQADFKYCPIYERATGSSGGGCFITTACVAALGCPDDGYELECMRHFRDSWLKYRPTGLEEIHHYYLIAPQIVEEIDKCKEKSNIYVEIYNRYIQPCVEMVSKEDFEKAYSLYTSMVNSLERRFLGKDH